MGGNEQKYVEEAFATNWVAPLGPHVDAFAQQLAAQTGTTAAAALSSGTAALHLALIIAGVQPGDYVICQSMTFCASANPIRYVGAEPVFVDSEPETWNMDPEALKEAIAFCLKQGKKPAAIIPVHLYGMPARMNEILELARQYEIPVIEDAAEALGSTYMGKPCGGLGDMGILSFNGNKIITTSGGGALVSNRPEDAARARFLSTQAREAAPHYQHEVIGYNYRMSNICAGIGRGQMEVLAERVAQRRANHNFYREALADLPGMRFLVEPEGFFSNFWLTTVLVDPSLSGGITREQIRLELERYNIESRPLWKPMHLQPVYEGTPYFGGDVAARLFENGLCLPSGSNLDTADRSRIAELIRGLWVSETSRLNHAHV